MAVSKKTRFEVFKRDSFTCQYCGRSAPDVMLQVDHIHPKSKGGEDDLLNLITSCVECNQGKKARLLSDDAAVKKRKHQLDLLQERREQLEMLMEWHRSLIDMDQQIIDEIANLWDELVPGYHLNENGLKSLRKWLKRFSLSEIIEGIKISVEQYLKYDDTAEDPTIPTKSSVEKAFDYVPRICASRQRMKEKPYLKDLYYIRGILRNRLNYVNQWKSIQLMEAALLNGWDVEQIREVAKEARNWTVFRQTMERWAEETPDNG
jgi:phosphoserine phosphatase